MTSLLGGVLRLFPESVPLVAGGNRRRKPPQETAAGGRVVADVVMVESKIGARAGTNFQLRRYAEHLYGMADYEGKALLYITRGQALCMRQPHPRRTSSRKF